MSEPIEPSENVEDPAPTIEVERAGFPWGFLVGTILLAAVIVFAVQNSDPVPIRFLWWAGDFPLSIAVAVAVFGAVILTQSIGAFSRRRRRKRKAEKDELRSLRGDD